jgi:predicted dehydrogenase
MALVGCGAIAERYYLPALAKLPGALQSLVLVDRDPLRAREMAERFDVGSYHTDHREVLGAVEGAILALPTHLHHPISMEFLSRGVHVLCEKPLSGSADRAREMVAEAGARDVVLAVNHQRRLYPNLATVRRMLADKALGQPLAITYQVGEKFDWPTVSGFYFNAPPSARGVLRDRGAHVMDVLYWWLGSKPNLVSCQTDAFGGSEALARVTFQHEGCRGEVKLSWLSEFPCRFVVRCEGGTVEGEIYDYGTVTVTMTDGSRRVVTVKGGAQSYEAMSLAMVTNFVGAMRGEVPPLAPGREAVESLQFIDECYGAATSFDLPWYRALEVEDGE